MGYLKHGKVSQIVHANKKDVFEFAANYENISKWSKAWPTGKVISKEGNTTVWQCDAKYFGIRFNATITGVTKPFDSVDENVAIDDGTIIHDHLDFIEISEGTRIDWSGDIPKLGKKVGRFGFFMKYFFDKSVKKELQTLAKVIENQ